MTASDSTVIPFPVRRRGPTPPDPRLVARAKRQAWLAVCYQPMPTKLHGTPVWLASSPIVIAIWWRLRARLWTGGPIADEPRELAQAAHVTLRTWRRNAEVVGRFFQRTETGVWFDPELETARQRALAKEERRALRRLQQRVDAGRARPARPASHQPRTAVRNAAQGELHV